MTLVAFFALIAFVMALVALARSTTWPWSGPVATLMVSIAVLILAFGDKIHL